MNSEVHPVVAALVILLAIATVGLWTWGSGEAKKIGGPAEIVAAPSGHFYIQIQNQLLEHDPQGAFLKRHDLSVLGVKRVLGTIGFFSNGDVLLRRGPDSRSLMDNIRAYQRKTNNRSLRPETPDTGLYRCNLNTGACSVFGTSPIDFAAAYSVYIDWRNDDVFISDTSRHMIRKYAEDGTQLAQSVVGLRFPNQLMVHDDQLLIANTNFHQVLAVAKGTDNFGAQIAMFDVVPAIARSVDQRWPSHFSKVGNEWWVNNMDSSMSGGGVYIFDEDWNFDRKVSLPSDADPISVFASQDGVLISDWNNDRVYRVANNGDAIGDFISSGLSQVIDESRQARLQYQVYAYAAVAFFGLIIVILIIKTLTTKSAGSPGSEFVDEHITTSPPSKEKLWLEPDSKVVRKLRMSMRLAGLLLAVVTVMLGSIVIWYDMAQFVGKLMPPLAFFIAFYVLVSWTNKANAGTAIGLEGDNITLRDHTGRQATHPVRAVSFDGTTIAAPNMAVFLGGPQMPLYEKNSIKSLLTPRLADANHISTLKMQAVLIQLRHPQGIFMLFVVIFSLVIFAWMWANDLL